MAPVLPSSRPLPRPGKRVPVTGWGVVSSGAIANAFAQDLALSETMHVTAIASRNRSRAERFAVAHSGAARTGKLRSVRPYDDLGEMFDDPMVELVYIASLNMAHRDHAIAAIERGQPVLCEKPLTVNAAEARELVQAARRRGTFLSEAMWTRHLPAVLAARKALEKGVIGEVRAVRASLLKKRAFDPASRLFDPAQGGGAMLDLGVYPLSLAVHFAGTPDHATGEWWANPAGTDSRAMLRLTCGKAEVEVACGFTEEHRNRLIVQGTRGALELDDCLRPTKLIVHRKPLKELPPAAEPVGLLDPVTSLLVDDGGKTFDFEGSGLRFQAERAAQCARHGRTEMPETPLDETIAVLEVIDDVRANPPAGRL